MTGMATNDDLVFKALADPNRRNLLDKLRLENSLTLAELSDAYDMSRQAVAKHLAVLEAANLVVSKKQGRVKRHYLNPVPINEIYSRWIGKFEQQHLRVLTNLKSALEGEQP